MAVLNSGAAAPMRYEPIPIAVVGFGRMGQRHAQTLARSPEFRIEAVIDVDRSLAGAASLLGVPFHAEIAEVFESVRVAVIAVPTECHADVFEQLSRHGIDCLIEKPIGTSLAELDRMSDLAARHGTRVFAGYCERFHPVVQKLRGMLGQSPQHIEVRRLSIAAPSRRFAVDVMLDLLVHDLDWLYSIIDEEPEEALLESSFSPTDQIEEVTCRLRFPGQLQARLTASRIADSRQRAVTVTLADGGLGDFSFDAPHDATSDDNLTAQAKALAAALRGERSSIAGLQDARRVMSLVERLRSMPLDQRVPDAARAHAI